MENNLPKGWSTCSLGDSLVYIIGGDWGKDLSIGLPSNFEKAKVIRGTDYKNWNTVKAKNASIRLIKKDSVAKRKLQKGDIVVEVSGGGPDQPVGRTVIICESLLKEELPIICSNFSRQMRVSPFLNPFYINYFLTYSYSLGSFNDLQTQTTNLRNLNVNDFLTKTIVPIPPISEQNSIVAKLDSLFEKIESNKQRLENIPQILKRFKQSVIAAAINGRLTEDWRKVNVELESAKQLIYRIHEQRGANTKSNKLKNKMNIDFSQTQFEKNMFDMNKNIPDSWTFTRIGDVSECLDYKRRPINKSEREKRKGNIPYYGANGQVGWIDNYLFDENLIVIVEDETFVGREIPFSYIIRDKTWVNNHAHVLRPLGGITVEYLNLCFSYYDFTSLTSGTTGRRKLTQEALLNAEFAIAGLQEQHEIVRRVEQLFEVADKIESRYNQARAMLEKLPQSILAKAFRGELVPQDPNDEPANALLERIRSEKAGPHPQSKKKKESS